jgi:hypothetical protein
MNEDALTRPEPSEVEQSVVGGEKDNGKASALKKRPMLRQMDDQASIGHGGGTEGREEQTHDTVTHGEVGNIRSNLGDNPGAFGPEMAGIAGVHPECIEDVAEVEARRVDGDTHVSRRERREGVRMGDEREGMEGALGRNVQTPCRRVGNGQSVVRTEGSEPRDEALSVSESELSVTGVIE